MTCFLLFFDLFDGELSPEGSCYWRESKPQESGVGTGVGLGGRVKRARFFFTPSCRLVGVLAATGNSEELGLGFFFFLR